MENNDSVLFQTTFRIKDQVSSIIEQKDIDISRQQKVDFKKDFKRFINIKKILGHYGYMFLCASLFVILIVFFALIARYKSSAAFYITFAILALLIGTLSFLVGKRISKNSKKVKKIQVFYFYLQELLDWTQKRMNQNIDINTKRYLIENYLQCCFDFVHQTQKDYTQLKINIPKLQQFLEREDFLQGIKLTIGLFETVYRQNDKYQQQGIFILIKILQPVTYMQQKSSLNKYINELQNRFLLDTKINTFNEYIMKIEQPVTEDNIIVYKNFAETNQNIFKLFVNYWKVNYQNKIFENFKIFAIKYCDKCGEKCYCNLKKSQNQMKISSVSHRQNENKLCANNLDNKDNALSNWSNLIDQLNQATIENKKNSTRYLDDIQQDISIVTNESMEQQKLISQQSQLLQVKPVQYFEFEKNDIKQSKQDHPMVDEMFEVFEQNDNEYETVTNQPDIRIQKLKAQKQGASAVTIKSMMVFEASKEVVYDMIFDYEQRERWDPIVSKQKVLKKYDQNHDLVYSYAKTPFIIEDRDFVIERIMLQNYKNFDYVTVQKSKDDPDHPPLKKVVRAQVIIQGLLIRQINDIQTELHMVNCTDFGGSIPKSLISALTVKAPNVWKKNFVKGLKNYKNDK